jgi:hypothetical protein
VARPGAIVPPPGVHAPPPSAAEPADAHDEPIKCLPDDPDCTQRLAELLGDTGRVWMLLPAKPADHISGVRLYAFHHLGDKLTCTELKFGMLQAFATLDQLSAASHGGAIDETVRTRLRLVQSAADRVRNNLTDTHDLRCANGSTVRLLRRR